MINTLKNKNHRPTNRSKNAGFRRLRAVRPASGFVSGDTDAAPQSRPFATVDR